MNLKILLPFRVFAEKTGVSRIVARTSEGPLGVFPHRVDCVTAIGPGILVYETEAEGEVFLATSEGVLVKTGGDVLVSVSQAVVGTDIAKLQELAGAELVIAPNSGPASPGPGAD